MELDLNSTLDFVIRYAPIVGTVIKILTPFVTDMFRKKTVYYTIKTERIKSHGNLIIIENFPITNFDNIDKIKCISTIFIWSDKHNIINGRYDIDIKCLPCINLSNKNIIFGARILNEPTTPDFNHAHICIDRHSCRLIFKQINHYHGLTVQIAHSAETSDQINFTSNMNVEKIKKVTVAKGCDMKSTLLALILIDICMSLIGVFFYINAPNQTLAYVSTILYASVVLATTLIWVVFNIKQRFLPSFVLKWLKSN